MNKILKKASVILVIALTLTSLALPIKADAKTIAEFEAEVKKYTDELQAKKDKIAANEQEVEKIKNKIEQITSEMIQISEEKEKLQQEIDASNEEIKLKGQQSKDIMQYYQVSQGNNSYLEYIFGAESITDMIYRMAIVEQLTEANETIMNELEQLVEENKKKKEELTKKDQELKTLEKELNAQKSRIDADTASLRAGMPSLEQQIKAAKSNISYYKKLGCGTNEDIFACQYRYEQAHGGSSGSIPSTNGFFRPIEYGYISCGFGCYSGHIGIDMSSSNKSITIYPIADGQVWYVGYDSYGALVVKIKHNIGGRYIYSTYAHMRSFSPYMVKGRNVSFNTPIGQMGSTGYSTGPHLHIEITTCDWNAGGGCTYEQYLNSVINPTRYINFPGEWNNR